MSMNPLRRSSSTDDPATVPTTAGATRDDVAAVRSERDDTAVLRGDRDRGLVDRDHIDRDHVDRDHVDRDHVDRDRDHVDHDHIDRDHVDRDPIDRDREHDLGERPALDRASVVAREREAFGGVKLGSAFFGWLTALGTAVLLTALVAAAATAVRVASGDTVTTDPATVVAGAGLRTDIAIVVILFMAYYCGGYVAGRMARFDGAKQGLAVWVLAVVGALLITALGAIAGARWDLLGTLNGFPRLDATSTTVTSAGVITTLIALAVALVGAVLGGLAGMRFHRRVDKVGLGR